MNPTRKVTFIALLALALTGAGAEEIERDSSGKIRFRTTRDSIGEVKRDSHGRIVETITRSSDGRTEVRRDGNGRIISTRTVK